MLKYFLSNPNMTGSICASSRWLAQTITAEIGLEKASAVAEIGPGTGAFTGQILKMIPAGCRFFAVEINESIALTFRHNYPSVTLYQESAANLKSIIAREGITALDAIVSGLPWACFPDDLQDELLTAIFDSLTERGHFTTFSYVKPPMPRDRRFRRKLGSYFPNIEQTPVVWKNMPPAFVFRCSK